MSDIDELLQAHARRVNDGDDLAPSLAAMMSVATDKHRSRTHWFAGAAAAVIVIGAAAIGIDRAGHLNSTIVAHTAEAAVHPLVGTQWQLVRIAPALSSATVFPTGLAYLFVNAQGSTIGNLTMATSSLSTSSSPSSAGSSRLCTPAYSPTWATTPNREPTSPPSC